MALRGKNKEKALKFVEELKGTIEEKFPEAQFRLGRVSETEWPCLWVYSNAEDADIWNLVTERQGETFVKEGINVYVIPLRLKGWEKDV